MRKRRGLAVVGILALGPVAAALLLAIPAAEASIRCEVVEGRQSATADFSNFTTRGTIRGDLEGTTAFAGDVTSLAPVVGTISPALNPSSHYTGDLTITTRRGILKTRSVGVFETTPNGLGTQFDRILGDQSTGRFKGATGHLYFNFQSDNTGASFTARYAGQICT